MKLFYEISQLLVSADFLVMMNLNISFALTYSVHIMMTNTVVVQIKLVLNGTLDHIQ